MGLYKWWKITTIWVIISFFLSSFIEGYSHIHDHRSLEAFLTKHVNNKIQKPKTGVFYNISLGANYTGMEITVVRLRSVSFYLKGVNHSFLNVPSHVVPQPNRKRMALVYENFGNLSSHYYNVPNYTLVAPVFGFLAYTSSETSFIDNEKMNLVIQRNPITIHFSGHVGFHARNNTPICVKFGDGGKNVEFKNMTKPYVCEANSQGYYTLVIPYSPKEIPHKKNHSITKRFNNWWVLGFVIGFVGLVLLVLIIVALVKAAEKRKLRKMERNSERGEAFDTFWIGETKLPLATMIRTQPVLEN